MIWWYLIPGVYHFRTRLKTPRMVLFWLLNVPGVIAVVSWMASDASPGPFVLLFTIALAAWQGIYEVGYLENDLVTTQRERDPTLRLAPAERTMLIERYRLLVAVKTLVTVGLVAAAGLIATQVAHDLNLMLFSAWLVGLRLVYVLHNATRGRLAIVTFGLLQLAKFGAVPLLLLDRSAVVPYVLAACIPVPMMVAEYAALPRFGLARLARIIQPYPNARVVYYAGLSLMLAPAAMLWPSLPSLRVGAVVASGLLVFRATAWIGLRLAAIAARSRASRSASRGTNDGT